MKPPYAIESVPSLSGHAIAYRWRSLPRVRRHRASKPQGSSERVLPWQVTMDQLIFASLSHTHYWYEVGMLEVPAVVPSYHTAIGANSLEHKERYDIITDQEWYILVKVWDYIRFGLRIETGAERTTIADIFDIIQQVRDTGIHLKVDQELLMPKLYFEAKNARVHAFFYRSTCFSVVEMLACFWTVPSQSGTELPISICP